MYAVTNSNNDSDYNKQHLDLYSHLPETLKTDTNRAVFKNLFDRYLTKQEVLKVTGYIGEGNPDAINLAKYTKLTYIAKHFNCNQFCILKLVRLIIWRRGKIFKMS